MEHDIKSKLKLGVSLTPEEESYYLLNMATHTERYTYLINKKEKEKCNYKNK